MISFFFCKLERVSVPEINCTVGSPEYIKTDRSAVRAHRRYLENESPYPGKVLF
jgi:hypothetical protein